MWIFTKYGFFSVVCARRGDGRHSEPVDPDRMMIRGRERSHLKSLKARFPEELAGCEIRHTDSTDYAFRLFVSKPAWATILAALAEETDYDNFKSAASRHLGMQGEPYVHALHEVWEVMRKPRLF